MLPPGLHSARAENRLDILKDVAPLLESGSLLARPRRSSQEKEAVNTDRPPSPSAAYFQPPWVRPDPGFPFDWSASRQSSGLFRLVEGALTRCLLFWDIGQPAGQRAKKGHTPRLMPFLELFRDSASALNPLSGLEHWVFRTPVSARTPAYRRTSVRPFSFPLRRNKNRTLGSIRPQKSPQCKEEKE